MMERNPNSTAAAVAAAPDPSLPAETNPNSTAAASAAVIMIESSISMIVYNFQSLSVIVVMKHICPPTTRAPDLVCLVSDFDIRDI